MKLGPQTLSVGEDLAIGGEPPLHLEAGEGAGRQPSYTELMARDIFQIRLTLEAILGIISIPWYKRIFR